MTIVIGLTGGIASGKSTVANMIREMGIPVIDADIIARQVVEAGEEAYSQIVQVFGETILLSNGEIDRAKLGSIIFHNEDKRLLLNSIVHPAVRKRMNEQKDLCIQAGERAVILDIPLLFESNLKHLVEKVLLIYVDKDIQLERLMKRNNLSEEEAKARIASQMPLSEKVALADEIINNNGLLKETEKQLQGVFRKWGIFY
ncbi:dephospho-CoA kinase [Bacillus sp. 165]|uniref:dephospho-CoA kinase n=1 Tax=Bacillus sp. 165 TaxID=1529117 RepID=UPI001ADC6997|nr:dephospho-CoA kinase [Bacillus sp. 165]MBO9130602.1 dephospho-CoA kinase [Bacillus sp. 165]